MINKFFQWTTIFILVNTVECMHIDYICFDKNSNYLIFSHDNITFAATHFNVNIIVMNFSVAIANCLNNLIFLWMCLLMNWLKWKRKIISIAETQNNLPWKAIYGSKLLPNTAIQANLQYSLNDVRHKNIFYFFWICMN